METNLSKNRAMLDNLLAKVLHLDPGDVTDETSMESVQRWDSVRHLMLVSELEKQFKITLATREAVKMRNIFLIKKALQEHGIEL
ncbi:MAG: acyl carrier protein [Elusimicrobia bacterium]|nr:acyl carrier protein [Elusimicrobiota bacterium]